MGAKNSKLKVINLIGPPGAGKSTAAHSLIAHLKRIGYQAEMVFEYAKTCVWWDRRKEMEDQFYISAKQNHKQFMLQDKVELIVTDSPILLGSLYMPSWMHEGEAGKHFTDLLLAQEQRYDNKYFFINRVHAFDPQGRIQSEEEAEVIERDLKGKMKEWGVQYAIVDGDESASAYIVNSLLIESWLPERKKPERLGK